jgi:hypothetical protein
MNELLEMNPFHPFGIGTEAAQRLGRSNRRRKQRKITPHFRTLTCKVRSSFTPRQRILSGILVTGDRGNCGGVRKVKRGRERSVSFRPSEEKEA